MDPANFSMIHKITVLEEMIEKMFQGLFHSRFREDDPNIRKFCVEALGKWILSYPRKFLKDSRLEYIAWTLIDKTADVRKASICTMKNIYKDNPELRALTEAISSRMGQLTNYTNFPLGVGVIHLIVKLIRQRSDVSLNYLYALLVHDPAWMRPALGKLVYEYLIRQGDGTNSPEFLVRGILKILKEVSGDRNLVIYVIDLVWEYMVEMKNQEKEKDDGSYFSSIWDCIVCMLLKEGQSTEHVDKQDTTNLVWLLCASVKKTVGERIVPATDIRKPTYNKQETLFEQEKQGATLVIMRKYPKLLNLFMDDILVNGAELQSLIEIILYIDPGVYLKMNQEKELENVPFLIRKIFNEHNDREVLRVCIKAIVQWGPNGLNYASEIYNDLHAKLKSLVTKPEVDKLPGILERLYELQLSIDVGYWNFQDFYKDLQLAFDTFEANEEVVRFCLLNMLLCLKACVLSYISEKKELDDLSMTSGSFSTLLKSLLHRSLQSKDNLGSLVCFTLNEFWSIPYPSHWELSPNDSDLQSYRQLCLHWINKDPVGNQYVEETSTDGVLVAAIPWVVSGDISKAKQYLCPEISQLVAHSANMSEILGQVTKFLRENGGLPAQLKDMRAEIDKELITGLSKAKDRPKVILEVLKVGFHQHVVVPPRKKDQSFVNKHRRKFEALAPKLDVTLGPFMESDISEILHGGIEFAVVEAPAAQSTLFTKAVRY
ncbi:hypothetical protein ABKV19_002469, partial [Rosa sericea]